MLDIAYRDLYQRSLSDPDAFWADAATAVEWHRPFDTVRSDMSIPAPGMVRWFPGGELNSCHNALDRHVRDGRGNRAAIIYESPVTGTSETISYRQMLQRTARFAGALVRLGVGKGDRVVIYMPTTPQALIAMLACARVGAIHSVVFGGFAPPELATRIDDCTPKLIIAASCGIEPKGVLAYKPLLDEALVIARHRPDQVVIWQRAPCLASLIDGRDVDWDRFIEGADEAPCTPVAASDALYILYTSGTTGQPKGVVRDNGGHAVALTWTMRHLYGLNDGECFWAASDIGWAVGHSYMLYGPLFAGLTSIVYEGKPVGTPDAGAFWRLIERHRVVTLLTAPTAIRAIKREDPCGEGVGNHDISSLRALFLAGERSDGDTLDWAERHLGVPVIDHWWQTETGWPITGNPLGVEPLPVKHGSVALPMPGWKVEVCKDGRNVSDTGEVGAIGLRLPLPPGALLTLWNADERFREAYLGEDPECYTTGDAGLIDEDGYIFIMARIDDVINVAGHRLSTGAIEEVLCAHPDVAEAAVVGVRDALKGQVPLGLLVLKRGVAQRQADIVAGVVQMVREQIGPVVFFKRAVVVERLPKTRSGKVLRSTIRCIADGDTFAIPATIDDLAILDEIAAVLIADTAAVPAAQQAPPSPSRSPA
jgi:propionyl-CoA synthetase